MEYQSAEEMRQRAARLKAQFYAPPPVARPVEPAPVTPVAPPPFKTARDKVRRICTEVGTSMGVPVENILGKSRERVVVEARHAAIQAVADAFPTWSLKMIARQFGMDHTSILHALKRRGTGRKKVVRPTPSNEAIVEAYQRLRSKKEAAAELHTTEAFIRYRLEKMGLGGWEARADLFYPLPSDDELLADYAALNSVEAVARKHERSSRRIRKRLRELGAKPQRVRTQAPYDPASDRAILRTYYHTGSLRETARVLKIGRDRITARVRGLGIHSCRDTRLLAILERRNGAA